ncbi:MAG: type II toxin-antitoxin system VapC family toxin [Actinomycetota bacterium]
MITAVDTNVVLDVFSGDPVFSATSRQRILEAQEFGAVTACDVVWAEVAAWFPDSASAADALGKLDIRFAALDPAVPLAAGPAFSAYRKAGGSRDRIVADFLIGAHAWLRSDGLLTRDKGFYRTYFKKLKVIDPSTKRG